MAEKGIESALSAEEWSSVDRRMKQLGHTPGRPTWGVIARANAMLPDDDPRKITRAKVELLREVAATVKRDDYDAGVQANDDMLNAFADALESYLPPVDG